MSNIVLFATYWNEIEWIQASLAQIDAINPTELIICDGCFDPLWPNYSTDGTREIIEKYVGEHSNAKLISALRLSRLQHYFAWFRSLPHEKPNYGIIAKLRLAAQFHRRNIYRLNQMATFNYMISISHHFREGSWFMTYDCDQFYSNAMLEAFKCINEECPFSIIVGREYTFIGNFNRYTEDYEKRGYNNMPHKIFHDIRFIPTRHPARIVGGKYMISAEFEVKRDVGIIFHYHVKSPDRLRAGYSLGDRKPPETSRVQTKPYYGEHPTIIKKFFLS
ncbi:MAG: hypothetical protein LWX55_07375 [Deltaproteobacteria bacterium]|jgi:hypothetical protein|nr:hypothetical protein [Deltaproteobacteria bacterium]